MSDFKVDNEVVCADFGGNEWITEGKTYSVLAVSPTQIFINNDDNYKVWYPKKLFTTIWKPKVGEECLWLSPNTGVYHHTKVIHIEDESVWLEGEGVVAHEPNRYKPLKTTAEIEREYLKSELDKDSYIHQMTDTFLLNNICEKVIASGYRKQKVKPLSKSYATTELCLSIAQYAVMIDEGFIVKGGE